MESKTAFSTARKTIFAHFLRFFYDLKIDNNGTSKNESIKLPDAFIHNLVLIASWKEKKTVEKTSNIEI